jgi:hypothetical protein
VRSELRALTPAGYTGVADRLVDRLGDPGTDPTPE